MSKKAIAFLGPAGSYTELALRSFLGARCHEQYRLVEGASISDVFTQLASGKVDLAIAPVENVIQGPVTETLDLLIRYEGVVKIICSFAQPIVHVLGVLPKKEKAADPRAITEVVSHFQALQQCSLYLDQEFPEASRKPVESTSKAVELLLSTGSTQTAVIASRDLIKKSGLEIIAEDISDAPHNQTRFLLLERGNVAKDFEALNSKALTAVLSSDKVTFLALNPGRDRQGLLHEILSIISIKHRLNLLAIHSRPDSRGGFVFFLELEGDIADGAVFDCLKELDNYCHHATQETARLILFGSYERSSFFSLPFQKVGIIGGKGEMGRWFQNFFESVGLAVQIRDQDAAVSLEEFVRGSEVFIISVPMSEVPGVVRELAPHLQAGQLVVENCSIKHSSLPYLLECCPNGVEVLGFHTMFGGRISTLRGENIIVTPTASAGVKAKAFEDLFYKHGAHIHSAPSLEHDRVTAYTQSLVHLLLISLGSVLRQEYHTAKNIEAFSTPNAREISGSLSRVLQQSNELIVALQTLNVEAPSLRRQFLEKFFNLVFQLEHGYTAGLLDAAESGREFLEMKSRHTVCNN